MEKMTKTEASSVVPSIDVPLIKTRLLVCQQKE